MVNIFLLLCTKQPYKWPFVRKNKCINVNKLKKQNRTKDYFRGKHHRWDGERINKYWASPVTPAAGRLASARSSRCKIRSSFLCRHSSAYGEASVQAFYISMYLCANVWAPAYICSYDGANIHNVLFQTSLIWLLFVFDLTLVWTGLLSRPKVDLVHLYNV